MIAFDTLTAATRLRQEAGFSEDQARVLVDTLAQCVDESLATKRQVKETEVALRREMRQMEASLRGEITAGRGDLKKTDASLRAEITELRGDLEKTEASLRADMRALEHRMTIKLGGIVGAALGILVALEALVF